MMVTSIMLSVLGLHQQLKFDKEFFMWMERQASGNNRRLMKMNIGKWNKQKKLSGVKGYCQIHTFNSLLWLEMANAMT